MPAVNGLAAFTRVSEDLAESIFIQQPKRKCTFGPVAEMVRQSFIPRRGPSPYGRWRRAAVAWHSAFTRPIRQLRNVVDATASGDLSNRVRTRRQDSR